MKPVHHALVSARLFGGAWTDYEPLHTAFDLSKMALGDMRHRAALHSVDHGGKVMALRFGQQAWPGTATLDALVAQHMDDDHGFPVVLDDWLRACKMPPTLAQAPGHGPRAAFLHAPEKACAAKWGGAPEDYAAVCAYFALPETCSDHPLAPFVSRNTFGVFFAESIFGPALSIVHRDRPRLVCVRDIGEELTLARATRLPTLGEVFSGMGQRPWMTGSKVEACRERRRAASGKADLFAFDTG